MTGRIITGTHTVWELPPLLEWEILRTGGVPCDSFTATCPYTAEMAESVHLAVSFLALDGEMLELHAQLRGITRLPAEQAEGTLRFSRSQAAGADLTIPQGSVCLTGSGEAFATTEAAVLPAGERSVDVPARAVEAGSTGNVAAGRITRMSPCPTGIQRCTNPAAFTGGREEEEDEALRARVLASYHRLPNGANAAFYQEAALAHSGVAAAVAVGRSRGTGTVDVYLTSPEGLPTESLLREVEADLAARREIAVDVKVLAPETVSVSVAAAILPEEGRTFSQVKAAVEETVRSLFTGERLGKSVLLAELGSRIYQADGVANCRLTEPTADLAAADTVLPVLASLTITEMEG